MKALVAMSLDGYAFIVGGGLSFCLNASVQSTDRTTGDGIGKACAIAFAKEGCLGMVIADINLEAAQAVAASSSAAATAPGFRAEAVFVDVTKEDSVSGAVARMAGQFPRIDYCVNSAGVCATPTATLFNRMLTWRPDWCGRCARDSRRQLG